jgi:hypothetical protein
MEKWLSLILSKLAKVGCSSVWLFCLALPLFSPYGFSKLQIDSVLFSTLFLILVFLIVLGVLKAICSLSKGNRLLHLSVCTALFGLFFLQRPGFLTIDFLYMMESLSNGQTSVWFGIPYSLVSLAAVENFRHWWLISLLQVLLYLWILAKALKWTEVLPKVRRKLSTFVLIGFSFSPALLLQVLLISRDSLFSLLTTAGLVAFLHFGLHEKKFNSMSLFTWFPIAFAFAFAFSMRPEGIAQLYLLAVLFICFILTTNRTRIFFGASVLAAIFFWTIYLPDRYQFQKDNNFTYDLTLYALPLSTIAVERFDDTQASDWRDIKNVVNPNDLVKYYNPLDIDAFHQGAFSFQASDEQQAKFKDSARKTILKNWHLIPSSRIKILLGALGFKENCCHSLEHFNKEKYEKFSKIVNEILELDSMDQRKNDGLTKQTKDFLYGALVSKNTWWRVLMTGLLPAILFLLFVGFSSRTNSIVRGTVLIVLFRLGVVLAVSPAAYSKYYFQVLLFALVLLPIFRLPKNQNI